MRLLRWQARWLDGFHGHAAGQFALRGANGTGKSGLVGPLLIYVALALRGTSVYFSASEKQTRQQMKTLLERLVARIDGIDATVYLHGVRFAGAGVVALSTAGEADSMQGSHGETLLIVADEAQALSSEQLQALQGCVVADDNWIVLSGNPLGVGTAFHRISTTADPSWQRTKVTAVEVVEDPEAAHIRGLVTAKGVSNLRQTWGEQSAVFQSRVMAEFPSQPADAMFPEAAIQAAFARWHDPEFRASQRAEGLALGVDVGASTDGDPSAMAVAWGGFVSELVVWFESDTMRSVAKVAAEFRRLRVAKIRGSAFEEREATILASRIGAMFVDAALAMGDPTDYDGFDAEIFVDEIGVGKGVGDRLREAQYPCTAFTASRRPTSDANALLYANLRAEAAARFRTKLIQAEVALPYSTELEEELRNYRGFLNSAGRLQIQAKDEIRELIHRSPDRLDAVIMAVAGRGYVSFGLSADMSGPVCF
jgi:phage terminase large subunit